MPKNVTHVNENCLNNPAVTAAIVGGRNPKQVDGIIGAGEFRLNQQELDEIEIFIRENP